MTCTTRLDGIETTFNGVWKLTNLYCDGQQLYHFNLAEPLDLRDSILDDITFEDFTGDPEDLLIDGWYSTTNGFYTMACSD